MENKIHCQSPIEIQIGRKSFLVSEPKVSFDQILEHAQNGSNSPNLSKQKNYIRFTNAATGSGRGFLFPGQKVLVSQNKKTMFHIMKSR